MRVTLTQKVRENVFDSIRFFLETDDVEFTEKIISIEELE